VRRICLICIGLWVCGLLAGIARAATFQLNNGQTVSGVLLTNSANDLGVQIRVEEGQYERVPWGQFSQADLRKFVSDKKMGPFVEPFIEITQEERIKKTEVPIRPVPRLERPDVHSLFGALFSSSVGLTVLLLLYAANIYAGYEVAVLRAQPAGLVCGVSAVAPVLGPVIFLSLPTRTRQEHAEYHAAPEAAAAYSVPPLPTAQPAAESAPGGLRLAQAEGGHATSALPTTQVFQRGAFTFNRRFFETKFPGFFGIIRRDAEKDFVIVIKSARGEFTAQRITRIAANDIHVQVQRGAASEEVSVPFGEIQEVQLKHKNA